jgi:hypothetical protein
VAHTCNLSYSGGRDQEDHSSKPATGKQFLRPYLKNTQHKTGLADASSSSLPSKREALSSNRSTTKKIKRERENEMLPQARACGLTQNARETTPVPLCWGCQLPTHGTQLWS